MAENYKVDNVDLKILEILMQDAKKPYTEVAKKAFVSGGTVHVRMNKLEEAGIVEKTTLKVNYAKLGYDITAFIGIFLQKSALYDQVMAKLKAIPEITNIHYTTGNYSMFTRSTARTPITSNRCYTTRSSKWKASKDGTMISLEESLDRSLNLT